MIGILLQQDIQFFSTPDASANRTTLIVLGIVVLIGGFAILINS